MKITPFIPLTLRGRFNESPYFKESLKPAFSFLACGELPYWLLASMRLCHLGFGIWNLAKGIATHLPGARNDTPLLCHYEALPFFVIARHFLSSSLRGTSLLCHCETLSSFLIARHFPPLSLRGTFLLRHCEALPFFVIARHFPPLSLRGTFLLCHCEARQCRSNLGKGEWRDQLTN